MPAICAAVRASSSIVAVISTTAAACCEEPEASSEAVACTALPAAATSIELFWICWIRAPRARVAVANAVARRSGSAAHAAPATRTQVARLELLEPGHQLPLPLLGQAGGPLGLVAGAALGQVGHPEVERHGPQPQPQERRGRPLVAAAGIRRQGGCKPQERP